MNWLGRLFGRAALDRELDAELRFHIEEQVAHHVAAGLSPDEARRRALVEFGGVDRTAEDCRDARGTRGVESTLQDLRYAARVLGRSPGFTAVAVISLALGLGANATIFSVANAVVLRSLPFPDAYRLVSLYEVDPRGGSWPLSGPNLIDLGRETRLLDEVAGFLPGEHTLTGRGAATPVAGAAVTASFFGTLDVSPVSGLTFPAGADGPGADRHVAVITRSLWTTRFQRDPAAVGGAIQLDGESYRLAGVVDDLPDLAPGAQVFVPLVLDAAGDWDDREIQAIGRLAPGATLAQARGELDGLGRAAATRYPDANAGWGLRAVDSKSSVLGPVVPRMVWVQFGAVALFGLLACVNVAGLLLARGADRRGELSVRAALGASRSRLVRQLLVESLLVGALGATAGLTLTAGAIALVRRFGASLVPRLAGVQLDGSVLLFTLALTMLAVAAFGLAPALAAARVGLQDRMRQGGRTVSARARARSVLVAAQAAIAMALLVGAGLLFKSFLTLSAVNPGFDPGRLLAVQPVLSGATWPDARLASFVSDLSDRLARLPGVDAAGATNVVPFGVWSSAIRYRRADRSPDEPLLQANWRTVTPGFFRAMGLRLLKGRLLDARDTADAPDVVVVTDSLAARTWPGEDPLGRQLVWGRTGRPKTVVGVVERPAGPRARSRAAPDDVPRVSAAALERRDNHGPRQRQSRRPDPRGAAGGPGGRAGRRRRDRADGPGGVGRPAPAAHEHAGVRGLRPARPRARRRRPLRPRERRGPPAAARDRDSRGARRAAGRAALDAAPARRAARRRGRPRGAGGRHGARARAGVPALRHRPRRPDRLRADVPRARRRRRRGRPRSGPPGPRRGSRRGPAPRIARL